MNTGKRILTQDVVYDATIIALEKDLVDSTHAEKQERWEHTAAAHMVKALPILHVAYDAPRDYAIRTFATPFGSKLRLYFSVRSNFVHFAYLADELGNFTITSNEIKQMVNADYSEETQRLARTALHVVDIYAWVGFVSALRWVIESVQIDPEAPIELDLMAECLSA